MLCKRAQRELVLKLPSAAKYYANIVNSIEQRERFWLNYLSWVFFCYLDIGLKPSNALFVRKKYRLDYACVSLTLFIFASVNHRKMTTKNSASI